ncbi:unnamed protein product [Owenia fusiformis]|uniref:Tetratricopeptide repeat protein 24 n=1 Tax=Owenia fusiformis TaxID=6347 RepID=A0A8S4PQV3_OWEFU|nr:unnamed protein product [Owenia fusiformis]
MEKRYIHDLKMKMERKVGLLSLDIDKFTKAGTEELQKGNLHHALDCFEFAYKRSLQLKESYTERACAFNLGAVYIALNQGKQGLELLHKAVPPSDKKDGRSNGDLFYNFALGYDSINDKASTVKYLELTAKEYKEENNVFMLADVNSRLAQLYAKLKNHSKAAVCFGAAASATEQSRDHDRQVVYLAKQASQLYQCGEGVQAVKVLDDCLVACNTHTLANNNTLGKLYNDLGLTYTQCKQFAKAAQCFEEALPLARGTLGEKKREAVVLQNLGAVYNSLGDFQRALGFHESAAGIHAELKNRNSQGQCFNNLAYAFSQLGDNDSAGESYLHALQAARDTGDHHAQWQALEGLGAVAFNNGQIEKAIRNFKQALSLIKSSEADFDEAQERIVGKLTDALQYQVTLNLKTSPVAVDLKNVRPSSASKIAKAVKEDPLSDYRKRSKAQRRKNSGEYESDQRHSSNHRNYDQPIRRENRRAASENEVDHGQVRQEGETKKLMLGVSAFSSGKKPRGRGNSFSSAGSNISVDPDKRLKRKPLLYTEDHDSEEEWKNELGRLAGDQEISSDEDFREKLRPMVTPSPGNSPNPKYGRRNHEYDEVDAAPQRRSKKRSGRESSSQDALKMYRQKSMESMGTKAMNVEENIRAPISRAKSFDSLKQPVYQADRRDSPKPGSPVSPNQRRPTPLDYVSPEQQSTPRNQKDARTSSALNGRKDAAPSTSSDSETGSSYTDDSETESEVPPRSPTRRHPPPVPTPLHSTYEYPALSPDYATIRSLSHTSRSQKDHTYHNDDVFRNLNETTYSTVNKTANKEKLTETRQLNSTGQSNPGDPLYDTIRSGKYSPIDGPRPSASGVSEADVPPPLPPPLPTTRGIRENVLYDAHVKQMKDQVELPTKEEKSKTCSIM